MKREPRQGSNDLFDSLMEVKTLVETSRRTLMTRKYPEFTDVPCGAHIEVVTVGLYATM